MPAYIHKVISTEALIAAVKGVKRVFVKPANLDILVGRLGGRLVAVKGEYHSVFILRNKLDSANIAVKWGF